MGRTESLVGTVGALLLAAATVAAQQPTATKFVTPFKGDAEVEMTAARAVSEGNLIVTKFRVKNMAKGPLVGFKVDEFWYSKKGDAVSGSPTFRALKPFMPGDVLEVTLRSPRHPDMASNIYLFAHANGKVKPKKVTRFTE